MSEPLIVIRRGTVTTGGQGGSTSPTYYQTGISTLPGPVVTSASPPARQPDESDPVLTWLASDEARRYRNHWVALNPATGTFLGLADALTDVRRWQAQDATVLFVDPEPNG
jgi:hypothetical protein